MSMEIQKNDDTDSNKRYPYKVILTKKDSKKVILVSVDCSIGNVVSSYEKFLFDIADKEEKQIGDI